MRVKIGAGLFCENVLNFWEEDEQQPQAKLAKSRILWDKTLKHNMSKKILVLLSIRVF